MLQKHGRMTEKLGWVFERIVHVFWNKYSAKESFTCFEANTRWKNRSSVLKQILGESETLGIFENLICKKQPTYIEWKRWNLNRASLINFLL